MKTGPYVALFLKKLEATDEIAFPEFLKRFFNNSVGQGSCSPPFLQSIQLLEKSFNFEEYLTKITPIEIKHI